MSISSYQPHAYARGVALASMITFTFVLTLIFPACNSSQTSSADDNTTDGLPCAVADVFTRRCQTCHKRTPKYGAPMPLVTHEDLAHALPSDPSRRVFEEVVVRIHDAARPMPKAPNPRLDAADMKVLDDWVAAGAPERHDACVPRSNGSGDDDAGSGGVHLNCNPDIHVRPASSYAMPADVDDILICYGWESTGPHGLSSKRHITALSPAIANAAQLHHVTLLQSDVAVSSVPGPCSQDAMNLWRPLYGWAPGSSALQLPAEAGLPIDPQSHYVVQLHYVNPTHKPVAVDTSGFDLCTTEKLRPNDADVMAFGTTEITIPARGERAVDCTAVVPTDGETTHLFAAFPHMHQLGTSISSVVHPAGGGNPVDLGTVGNWDIGNQTWLPIDYTLRPGDVVQSKCSWRNPTSHGVGYGPTSDDEMCFSFVMYFPKIQTQSWHWSLPALYSTCR